MDVKYFKPVKRTEENSAEEWLILCLISQVGGLPRGLARGFGPCGEWMSLGHSQDRRAPSGPKGSWAQAGAREAVYPADPTLVASDPPRNLLSASGPSQPRSIEHCSALICLFSFRLILSRSGVIISQITKVRAH